MRQLPPPGLLFPQNGQGDLIANGSHVRRITITENNDRYLVISVTSDFGGKALNVIIALGSIAGITGIALA